MNKKLVAFLLSTGILVSTCGTAFANEVALDQPVETVNTPAPPINTTEAPQVNIEEPTEEVVEEEKPEEKQEVKDKKPAEEETNLRWEQKMSALDKEVIALKAEMNKVLIALQELRDLEIDGFDKTNMLFEKVHEGTQILDQLKSKIDPAIELHIVYGYKLSQDVKALESSLCDLTDAIINQMRVSHEIPNIPDIDNEIIQNIPNNPLDKEKPEENTPPVKDIINMTNALPKVEEPIEFVNNNPVNAGNDVVENTIGENMKEMVELPKAEELPKVETPKAYESMNKATSTVSESGSKMGSSSGGTSTSYSRLGTSNPKTGDYTTLGASIATMIAGIAGIFVSRKR